MSVKRLRSKSSGGRPPHYLDVWGKLFNWPVHFRLMHHVAGLSVDEALALAKQLKISIAPSAIVKAREQEAGQ